MISEFSPASGSPEAGAFFIRGDGYIHRRNLHLLWEPYLKPLKKLARAVGGSNAHGAPLYRIVYGWESPDYYMGAQREFFHLQRWVNLPELISEEEWDWQESIEERREPLHKRIPFPRHGDYLHVRTCRWGKPVSPVPLFRRPDEKWVSGAIIANQLQRARTAGEIRADLAETRKFKESVAKEKAAKVADQFRLRELMEDYTSLLIANPTLRSDPSLFLSPAVAYKRTRHAIRSNL